MTKNDDKPARKILYRSGQEHWVEVAMCTKCHKAFDDGPEVRFCPCCGSPLVGERDDTGRRHGEPRWYPRIRALGLDPWEVPHPAPASHLEYVVERAYPPADKWERWETTATPDRAMALWHYRDSLQCLCTGWRIRLAAYQVANYRRLSEAPVAVVWEREIGARQ